MADCKTINCPTCNFELDESFLEQRCPRCQSIIEAKNTCGSCSNCHSNTDLQKKENLLSKIISIFK